MLNKIKYGILFLAITLIISCSLAEKKIDAPAKSIVLAENGLSKSVIVISSEAPEPEKYAAAELSDFLQQISSVEFEVVNLPVSGKSSILVGSEAAKLVDKNFSTEGLGADGIVIRTVGNDIILAGGRPRGTLYAVYTFLENQFGCRWWASNATTIPAKSVLEVGNIDTRYVPVLEYREPYWFDAFDGDWAVRNKCNGQGARLDVKQGGKILYEGFVHTFYHLIPPDKYFNEHPEWFSEIDGIRTCKNAQLCLTNQEMKKELIKNLKERLRKNPVATIASVSQNDCIGNCQCNNCAAVEKEARSPAGLLLQFVNSVAEEIEQEFPNVAISTLAYQYTRKPPIHVKPRHNVIVRLCSIECSFCKPLADEHNKTFRDDIINWSKICNRLYIWDYTTNFRHYIMPHPNLRVLGPNIKFFVENNVKGIFEQGAYQSYGAEMAELRAWVLAKLLWDSSLDAQKLIDEFIDGYYGAASPHIKAYLNTIHDAVEESGDYLNCFSKHDAKFLSFETLSAGWAHLNAAEAAVKDNPDLLLRAQVAELPVMYTFMLRWDEMREKAEKSNIPWCMTETIEETYEQFMEIAKKKKIGRLNEWSVGFDLLKEVIKRTKK
ncbi:MAG: DUF4838 domain-containing protein [Planctomycetota bacterium]